MMIIGVVYFSVFWSMVEVHSQPTVTISKSPSGAVCAGTELTLTSHIHLGNAGGNEAMMDVSWMRGSEAIVNNSHTTVSTVSFSGSTFTNTLTFSPVTSSDGGNITVRVEIGNELLVTFQIVEISGKDIGIIDLLCSLSVAKCRVDF